MCVRRVEGLLASINHVNLNIRHNINAISITFITINVKGLGRYEIIFAAISETTHFSDIRNLEIYPFYGLFPFLFLISQV